MPSRSWLSSAMRSCVRARTASSIPASLGPWFSSVCPRELPASSPISASVKPSGRGGLGIVAGAAGQPPVGEAGEHGDQRPRGGLRVDARIGYPAVLPAADSLRHPVDVLAPTAQPDPVDFPVDGGHLLGEGPDHAVSPARIEGPAAGGAQAPRGGRLPPPPPSPPAPRATLPPPPPPASPGLPTHLPPPP